MSMKKIIVVLCILFTTSAQALVIGSNTNVSVESFVTFPESDMTANQIVGFAMMANGFALENSSTDLLFSGYFPVKKQLELNGGTVTLDNDLDIQELATFTLLGNIQANTGLRRKILLPSILTSLGDVTDSTLYTFKDIDLIINRDLVLYGALKFEGECSIISSSKVLDLSSTGSVIVASNSTLLLKGLDIVNVANQNIRCEDDTAAFIISDSSWTLSDDYSFQKGSISFLEKNSFMGTYTFSYDSAYTSTIETNAEWELTQDLFLILGRNATSNAESLYFKDSSATLKFDRSSFQVTNQGMNLTHGHAEFNNVVNFEFLSTSTSTGVVLGNGSASGDFFIDFNAAAVLNFNKGHLTYNNSVPNAMRSKARTARIVRTANSYIYNAQNHTFSNFTIQNLPASVPPITVQAGKTVLFDGVRVMLPDIDFDLTCQQYTVMSVLLGGNHKVVLVKGPFPLAIVVSGTGNMIQGNGVVGGPIVYLSPIAQLTWSNLGLLNSSITFNGGTLLLGSDLILKEGATLVGSGTISLQNKSVQFPIVATTQSSNLIFTGNGDIVLNANMTLNANLTFNNVCTIKGNGHTLNIQNGHLIVNPNAHLILQNVVLDGVHDTVLTCSDSSGVITFDKTKIIQTGSSSISYGALRWMNSNKIEGAYTFAYQSTMTSTLLADSKLNLEPGVIFNFDPPLFDGCNKLLEFIDESSQLVLNGASLLSTTSGIELVKGTLMVKRTSFIGSDSVIDFYQKHGVSLGNGIDDMNIVIAPEAELYLTQGVLEYRNLSSYSLVMLNSLSAIRIAGGAALQLFEDLDLRPGFVVFDDLARVYYLNGVKQIIGSINPQGKLYRKNFQV